MKIVGRRPHLHGLRGMGARPRQHRCNFVAEDVTEISSLTNTTPWLRPLPATCSPRETKTACCCGEENRRRKKCMSLPKGKALVVLEMPRGMQHLYLSISLSKKG